MTTAAGRTAADLAVLAPARTGRPVWLRVGTVLDGSGGTPLQDAHLVYDADRIRYVGPAFRPPPPEFLGGPRTGPDAWHPDLTACPMLIEAHAHLFLDGAPIDRQVREAALKLPAATMLDRARARLIRLARMGVQAVRDAGDRHGVGLAVQAERDTAPDRAWVDSPGPALYHRGRYGEFMGRAVEDLGDPEACVEAFCAAGSGRIKLLATGIINFAKGAVTAPPQMTAAEVAAFVAAAHRLGRPVFAHASGEAGVDAAVDGGVDTVEHGFFVSSDQLSRMRDRGTAWVPTFIPVRIQLDRADEMGWGDDARAGLARILEGHARSLREAHAKGVTILAGSDAGSCGVPHGLGLQMEMECLEAAGLPARAVLAAATGRSAGTLAFAGPPLGRLAAGCRARLILTRHSPDATIANLRRPRLIVWDGAVQRHAGADAEPAEGL